MIWERKILHLVSAVGLLIAVSARFAPAQQVPAFFGGGVVAYDPEVSTIQSGAIMDAQATVSDDHKYVTLNMRAGNSRLQSLQNYPVSTVNQGFVGGASLGGTTIATPSVTASAGGGAGVAAAAARTNLVNPSPEQIQRQARGWILARQGMYLVKPLP